MSNALADTLIALSGDRKFIVVHRAYVEFFADFEAAMLWESLLNWAGYVNSETVVRSDKQFCDELYLGRREFERAKRVLKESGVCEVWSAPSPYEDASGRRNPWPLSHWRIRMDVFAEKWGAWAANYRLKCAAEHADATADAEPSVRTNVHDTVYESTQSEQPSRTNVHDTVYKTPSINTSTITPDSNLQPPTPTPTPTPDQQSEAAAAEQRPSNDAADSGAAYDPALIDTSKVELPKSSRKSKTSKPSIAPELYVLAEVLAEVCNLDFQIAQNRARLLKAAKEIYPAKVKPTPQLIREKFGTGGWWYTESGDFRAWTRTTPRMPVPPRPDIIIERWGSWPAVSEEYNVNSYTDVFEVQRQGIRWTPEA